MSKSKNATFTEEENLLITAFDDITSDGFNYDEVAETLLRNLGNKDFNKRLTGNNNPTNKLLATLTYKTQQYEDLKEVSAKINIASQLAKNSIPVSPEEKISISDIGKLSKLASLGNDDSIQNILNNIYKNTNNPEFKNFCNSIKQSKTILDDLQNRALESEAYNSGDLMMYLTSKTSALKERQAKIGHEGKLEEIFVTKYNHAAPIYLDTKKLLKSDVWHNQRSEEVNLLEILQSDTFHIDPVKLVDKKYISKLEQIDYGYKTDLKGQDLLDKNRQKIKLTWQDVVRDRYQQMSAALHQGLVPASIKKAEEEIKQSKQEQTLLNKRLKKYGQNIKSINPIEIENNISNTELEIDKIKSKIEEQGDSAENITYLNKNQKKLAGLRKQLSFVQPNSKIQDISNEIQKETEKQKRLTNFIENKGKLLLLNDQDRLSSAMNWVGPKAITQGHNYWRSKDYNDLRDLSQKMFTAHHDQRLMICSEFSARSIASCIDQTNRLMALDLMAHDLVDKEKTIIKNPISNKERFDRIHPERLVKILQDSGCTTQVQNNKLSQIVNTQDVTLGISKNISLEKNLAAKTLYLLKFSQSKEIYDSYKKQPNTIKEKITKAIKSILAFCHIISKDKDAKKAISNLRIAAHKVITKPAKLNEPIINKHIGSVMR
jgi:hypothetical protein